MCKRRVVYFFVAIALSGPAVYAATVNVNVTNFVFDPPVVTLSPGDTVQWTWGVGLHTVTSDDAGATFNSGAAASAPHTFSFTFPSVGFYPYYCSIHGGPNGFGMSGVVNVKAGTTTSLSSQSANTVYGQNSTLTAVVTVNPPASGTPTGTVTFFDGAAPLCANTGFSGSGTAVCSTASLTVGTHTLTATYNGDSTYNTSTSNPVQQTVGQASSTTTLNSSPNPSGGNQVVAFTATVAIDSPGSGTPTGIVRFKESASQLCPDVTLNSGTALCNTSALSPGTHAVTAQYLGDGNVAGSTSDPVQQVVHTPPPVPGGFSAAAIDASSVQISWQPSAGATGYDVFRRSVINGALTPVVTDTPNTSETDMSLAADTTYLYQVRAVSSNGVSLLSPIDPATTVMFLAPGAPVSGELIRAQDFTQVRKAVRAMYFAGNGSFPSFAESVTANFTPIRASHVIELRTLLDNARSKIGVSALSYSPITANTTPVQPIHVTEVYAGTQ